MGQVLSLVRWGFVVLISIVSISIQFVQAQSPLEEAEDSRGEIMCLERRCAYRLLNPARVSAAELINTVRQADSGEAMPAPYMGEGYIQRGEGRRANLEIVFWHPDVRRLEALKEAIQKYDLWYNRHLPEPIRLTVEVYTIKESGLSDFGFGLDGYLSESRNAAPPRDGMFDTFGPQVGGITGFIGNSVTRLFRLSLRAAVENQKAELRMQRQKTYYNGSRFQLEDTQNFYRDAAGGIQTTTERSGFSLSGTIFEDLQHEDR